MLRGTFLSLYLNDESGEWFIDAYLAVVASESSGSSIRQILGAGGEGEICGMRECSSPKAREEPRSTDWCYVIQTMGQIIRMTPILPSRSRPASYSVAPRRLVLFAADGWFRPNDLLS